MSQSRGKVAWQYHEATSHSDFSVRTSGHYMDFDNQPLPFKIYETLPPIELPTDGAPLAVSALAAEGGPARAVPTLEDVSRLLHYSAGIMRRIKYPGGTMLFRAAACTGALYEIDVYVVCGDIEGLAAGVYHFSPHDFSLRLLRAGDFRGNACSAAALSKAPPVLLLCSGTYWRNAWKYQARTYRHFGWDNGTLLGNLLAMASAMGLPAELLCGFVDIEMNLLLDLDTDREVVFSAVVVGEATAALPPSREVSRLDLKVRPLSRHEVDYPLMRQLHAASSLNAVEAVTEWRQAAREVKPRSDLPTWEKVSLPSPATSDVSIETVIAKRGSSRRFTRDPLTAAQLSAILQSSTRGLSADYLGDGLWNELYLIVNAVEGVPSGAYRYADGSLLRLKAGNFREDARYLDLGQDLAGDAAVNVYFMADLHKILDKAGNRGYRAAQLESGILGGNLYLASYALGLGATGLTFFDDDVVQFFSPDAAALKTIFLVAIGRPAPRRRIH